MSTFQLNVKLNGAEQTVKTIGDVESALKATREELKNLEIGSEAFEELALQARLLQDELKGSFKEATNFDVSLGKLSESVTRLGTSVAAGFAITTTAFQIFGKESDELSQAQIKAQQALTLAFSATTLATNAAKLSGDLKLVTDRLQLGITNLLTTAFGRETVAKAASAVATGTATAAQRALNIAMSANPVLLLVGALGLLVGALVTFSLKSKDSEQQTKNNEFALSSLNEEIERNLQLRREEINRERELINLKGRLLQADAKTESERLKIRQKTFEDLLETQRRELDSIESSNLQKLEAQEEFNVKFLFQNALFRVERERELQDAIDTSLTQEDRFFALLQDSYNKNQIDFVTLLERKLEFQKDFNKQRGIVLDEETTKANNALSKQISDIRKSQRDRIQLEKTSAGELVLIQKQITDAEKREGDERLRSVRENIKKTKQELEAFNQDQITAIQKRNTELKKIEREFQDFLIDRISEGFTNIVRGLDETGEATLEVTRNIQKLTDVAGLLNQEFSRIPESFDTKDIVDAYENLTQQEKDLLSNVRTGTDDLIRSFDERIVQLEFLGKRQREDAELNFQTDKENFKRIESARTDANGKRVISNEQIDEAIAEQTKRFNTEQELRIETFNEKIKSITQQRADKILEIEEILKQEIAFGDNSTNDNKSRLLLEAIDEEIEFSQRRLLTERRINIDLIKERQESETKKRKILRDSLLEQERIELELALKSVQGTEEQKGRQRLALIKLFNDRVAKINREFREGEKNAEQINQQEILDAQLARINLFADSIFAVLNQIVALASAIEEGNRISLENQLNDIRDSFTEQQNVITESYNAELEAQNQRLQSGQISQEAYNQSVKALNEGLAKDSIELENEKREIELDLKEKAFNDEKKLKIASTIIAGFQGALQAFSTAFQLGPIAGPIVGGILAALVATTTGIQVANIKKTKFDRGAPASTPKLGGTGGGASSAASAIQNLSSSGGLTQFDPDLVNNSGSGNSNEVDTGDRSTGDRRVFVLESDITGAQNRVSVAESSATFG